MSLDFVDSTYTTHDSRRDDTLPRCQSRLTEPRAFTVLVNVRGAMSCSRTRCWPWGAMPVNRSRTRRCGHLSRCFLSSSLRSVNERPAALKGETCDLLNLRCAAAGISAPPIAPVKANACIEASAVAGNSWRKPPRTKYCQRRRRGQSK